VRKEDSTDDDDDDDDDNNNNYNNNNNFEMQAIEMFAVLINSASNICHQLV
jgi:hypothetical protein